jgi:hypothetical protein
VAGAGAADVGQRADRIFVKRCQQGCQVDAKGDTAKANKCVDECGKQPQRTQVVKDCSHRTTSGRPLSGGRSG